jgi:hypothetical protein
MPDFVLDPKLRSMNATIPVKFWMVFLSALFQRICIRDAPFGNVDFKQPGGCRSWRCIDSVASTTVTSGSSMRNSGGTPL